MPVISPFATGLRIDGFDLGPHYLRPADARALVRGHVLAELVRIPDGDERPEDGLAIPLESSILFRPGLDDSAGFFSAPLGALKSMLSGLCFDPIDLEPAEAPTRPERAAIAEISATAEAIA